MAERQGDQRSLQPEGFLMQALRVQHRLGRQCCCLKTCDCACIFQQGNRCMTAVKILTAASHRLGSIPALPSTAM